jgi:hypothetical protein
MNQKRPTAKLRTMKIQFIHGSAEKRRRIGLRKFALKR